MKQKSFAHIYMIDGKGGATLSQIASLSELSDKSQSVWIHLDLSDKRSVRWIKKQPELNELIRENLLNPDSIEPPMRLRKNKILITLRSVNIKPKAEPDDLVFLRLYATEKILITTSLSPVIKFSEIDELFEDDNGPETIDDLLASLVDNTLDNVSESITDIEDDVDDFEELIILRRPPEGTYSELSELLRQVLIIRRFMMPEREVLDLLLRHGVKWFNADALRQIRDNFERVRRIIEDIDLLEKRIRVNQDAISHLEDKQTQKNMYMLSVIAGIFLPLSFFASVFGMNLGGIPLATEGYGFMTIVVMMVLIGLIIWYLFKRLKWI